MSLARSIAPTRTGEGAYRFEVSPAWSFRKTSGGVLVSCALAAAREALGEVAPELELLSATAAFIEPLDAGVLEAEVEILRRGRSAAQVRARLFAKGSAGLEALATFARERPETGFDVLIAEPPAATPVADALDIGADDHPNNWHVRTPFFQNFDTRLAIGTPFWRDRSGVGIYREVGRWFRYKEPPVRGEAIDPLALPPIADTMPAALWQFLGPGRPFYAPSLDLTVHFLEPAPVGWLLSKSYVRWAGRGYATGEAEIWTEEGRLVGFATQMMMIATRQRR